MTKKYEFPCGVVKEISDFSYGKYEFFGKIEACMHDCPKGIGDPNGCRYYAEYYEA